MATLDNLFEWMKQRQIERAVFVSDQPAKFYVNGKESTGDVWPMKRLHNFAWEILPDDQRPQLSGQLSLSISHQSSLGLYKIIIQRGENTLKVDVAPEVCWFCQKRQPSRGSMLHHKMIWRRQVGRVTYWDRKALEIPRCSLCQFWHGTEVLSASAGLAVVTFSFFTNYSWFAERFGPNASVWLGLPILWTIGWQIPRLFVSGLGTLFGFVTKSKVKQNPDYQAARGAGFNDVLY